MAAESHNYTNIVGAATTIIIPTIVGGAVAQLKKVVINNPVAGATITIYDNGAASGNKVGTITIPATVNATGGTVEYTATLKKGLTIVTTGASLDITVTWI